MRVCRDDNVAIFASAHTQEGQCVRRSCYLCQLFPVIYLH